MTGLYHRVAGWSWSVIGALVLFDGDQNGSGRWFVVVGAIYICTAEVLAAIRASVRNHTLTIRLAPGWNGTVTYPRDDDA